MIVDSVQSQQCQLGTSKIVLLLLLLLLFFLTRSANHDFVLSSIKIPFRMIKCHKN